MRVVGKIRQNSVGQDLQTKALLFMLCLSAKTPFLKINM